MTGSMGLRRAVALVDGEHYPAVVREALAELPYDVVGAVLVGGSEKLRSAPDFGVPLAASLDEAVARYHPDLVLDLSDEPVLGPRERLALVGRALALGVPVEGADFRFDPPSYTPIDVPSVAVIGTGKRVGKTAVTGLLARSIARERRLVVVAMGRGGPAEPEVVDVRPTVESLLALSRSGRHAASDHLETAALAGVPTVGCRRCGGGLAGAVGLSNVLAGVRRALELEPDVLLLDGSGAAIPPIAADRRVLVVGAHQSHEVSTGYLNGYRALVSDAIVVTTPTPGHEDELVARVRGMARHGTPVVRATLCPTPVEVVAGERVAYFGTAPADAHPGLRRHLEERHDARVVHVSGALADRERLRVELAGLHADTLVVELKAAAVDVVVEHAAAHGLRVVLAANDLVTAAGDEPLEELAVRLADEAIAERAAVVP